MIFLKLLFSSDLTQFKIAKSTLSEMCYLWLASKYAKSLFSHEQLSRILCFYTLENQNRNQFENPKINSCNIDTKATVEMLNRKPRLPTIFHQVIYWPDGWPYYSIPLADLWNLCDDLLLLYLRYLPFRAVAKTQNFVKLQFLH